MSSLTLAVRGSGLVTSVGFNAPATLAAIRAGVDTIELVNLWDWEAGENLRGARVPLPQWSETLDKWVDLAATALTEGLRQAQPEAPTQVPVFLGVPAPERRFIDEGLDELLEMVQQRLQLTLHPASRQLGDGRISLLHGLQLAAHAIEHNHATCCIIAGVDSFMRQSVANAYMDARRLLTASNSDGFIPGEAATAILVGPRQNNPEELTVLGVGAGQESGTIESTTPLSGDGITQAVRSALGDAKLPFYHVDYLLNDLNGESYRFKEAHFIEARFDRKQQAADGSPLPDKFRDLWHPIEYVGDIGAAIGPLLLAIAQHAGHHGYAPGPVALHTLGNDDGRRAAVITHYQKQH